MQIPLNSAVILNGADGKPLIAKVVEIFHEIGVSRCNACRWNTAMST
jgi:hypothetical protein